jgi:hypothetical protein
MSFSYNEQDYCLRRPNVSNCCGCKFANNSAL